mgnify:CR=1 FL=1
MEDKTYTLEEARDEIAGAVLTHLLHPDNEVLYLGLTDILAAYGKAEFQAGYEFCQAHVEDWNKPYIG